MSPPKLRTTANKRELMEFKKGLGDNSLPELLDLLVHKASKKLSTTQVKAVIMDMFNDLEEHINSLVKEKSATKDKDDSTHDSTKSPEHKTSLDLLRRELKESINQFQLETGRLSNINKNLEKELEDLKMQKETIQENSRAFQQSTLQGPDEGAAKPVIKSYAEALSLPLGPQAPGLLINSGNSTEALQDLEGRLNTVPTTNINFSSSRTRNGKILLKFPTDKEKHELKERLLALDDKLEVTELQPRKKNIIIFDAPKLQQTNEEDRDEMENYKTQILEPALKRSLQGHFNNYRLLKTMISKDGKGYNLILQLDEIEANFLISKRKIQMGFIQCNVDTYFSIPRCTKCQAYTHTKKNCQNCPQCGICARRHFTNECKIKYHEKDKTSCINCLTLNEKDNGRRDTFHPASWGGCPVFRNLLQEAKNRGNKIPSTKTHLLPLTSPNRIPLPKRLSIPPTVSESTTRISSLENTRIRRKETPSQILSPKNSLRRSLSN